MSSKKPATKNAVDVATTEKIVEKVSKLKAPDMLRHLSDVQSRLMEGMSAIAAPIADTLMQWEEVNIALTAQKARLAELHSIDADATTVEDLKQQIADLEVQYSERTAELAKQRSQEEADFNYNLTFRRRTEADTYQKQLAQRNEVLQAREAALVAAAEELEGLRKAAEGHAAALDRAAAMARNETRQAMERDHNHAIALMKAEHDGDRKLAAQRIAGMELEAERLNDTITRLNEQVGALVSEVSSIAGKTVEAAGAQQALTAVQNSLQTQGGAKSGAR